MKQKILLALSLLLLACAFLQPLSAQTMPGLEPDRSCSLTLFYTQDNQGFAELPIRIYRVAEALPDGTFRLVKPFSDFPVNIHGVSSQREWQLVASTLRTYITAQQIEPTQVGYTDAEGTVVFTQLQTGLYLVDGVLAEKEAGTYRFNDFMIYLPTPKTDGLCYDMEAKPKCTQFTPNAHYNVVKLWKDAGSENSRPQEVTVEIRKDDQLYETVVLNAENNWSYSWRAPLDNSIWSVLEKDVAQEYTVTVSENEHGFVITNTKTTHVTPPQTGDMFPLWLVAAAMCFSGFALVLLGIWRERKQA